MRRRGAIEREAPSASFSEDNLIHLVPAGLGTRIQRWIGADWAAGGLWQARGPGPGVVDLARPSEASRRRGS